MNRKILHLAVPSIISNITVPLLGLVDVAITGHMGEGRFLAAIAVGSMVFNIIYWLFSFLRFGTGGMTAQAYGENFSSEGNTSSTAGNEPCPPPHAVKDRQSVCYILMKSLFTSTAMALLILLLQVPLFYAAMWFIAPEASLLETIHTYYNICIWGTIPSLALYALTGWFVGMQNTKLPMIISITQNIVNILLSLFFVYVLHMKIEGVALGTMIAQWSGAIMAVVLLIHRYGGLWKGFDYHSKRLWHGWGKFFSVNKTLFYRTLFLVAVNLYFIVAGAKGGAEILAVNSVLMHMFILYTYVMDGFAFAAEALCGRYYGARDKESFSLAMRGVWLWSLFLTIAYTAAYAIGGDAFMRLLTDDAAIRTAAQDYIAWAIAIPFCGIAAFVWDGVFIGMTNMRGMLWGTSTAAVTFFVLYFALEPFLHNHALWLAFNAYLFMRGFVQGLIFYWRRRRWLKRNKLPATA